MKSIAKFAVIRKRSRIEKTPHAVIINGDRFGVVKLNRQNLRGNSDADGRIKGLSRLALDRLRGAIARTAHIDGSARVYGCCFTIPWGSENPDDPRNPTRAQAAAIWHRFTNHINRFLDAWRVGIIFRVELQTRKAVHWHMMVYISNKIDCEAAMSACTASRLVSRFGLCLSKKRKGKSRGRPRVDVGKVPEDSDEWYIRYAHFWVLQMLRLLWCDSCKVVNDDIITAAAWSALGAPVVPGVDHAAELPIIKTFEYCFDSIPLDGVKSGIAYLASHTTKHKVDQLGYDGKQWGYLGRKWLCEPKPEQLDICGRDSFMSYRLRVLAFRLVRRWLRVNRFGSDWRVCRPRSKFVNGGSYRVDSGLVVGNSRSLYLFGTPAPVVQRAFECALDTIVNFPPF